MKKVLLIMSFMVIVLSFNTLPLFAQVVTQSSGNFLSNLSLGELIAGVVVIYEAVVRIVPTVQNVSLLNSIFGWLKRLSETLNVKKKIG